MAKKDIIKLPSNTTVNNGTIDICGVSVKAEITTSDIIGVKIAQIENDLTLKAKDISSQIKANEREIEALKSEFDKHVKGFDAIFKQESDKFLKIIKSTGINFEQPETDNYYNYNKAIVNDNSKTVSMIMYFKEIIKEKKARNNRNESIIYNDVSFPFTKEMNKIKSDIEKLQKINDGLQSQYSNVLSKKAKLPAMERQARAEFTKQILRNSGKAGNDLVDSITGDVPGINNILND